MCYPRSLSRLVAAAAVTGLFLCPVQAAYIDVAPAAWDPTLVMVRLRQEIVPGDASVVRRLVTLAARHGRGVVLDMESWGGDSAASMELAALVVDKDLTVYVSGGCKSGCAFAVLVAAVRGKLLVGPFAKVGVHQAWDQVGKKRVPNMEWTRMMAHQLEKYGVPREPIDAMLTCDPDGMVFFNAADLIGWGGTGLEQK